MIYLIAKIAVLLLLAAVCGFLLGRWWIRRSFVDVTESYETISQAASTAQWHDLWNRFDDSEKRMRQIVKEELRGLPQAELKVDLDPLRDRIAALDSSISSMPAPEAPAPVDLTPMTRCIDRIESLAKSMNDHSKLEPQKTVDLVPLHEGIAALDARISAIATPERPEQIDLDPIKQRIEGVETALRDLEFPPGPELGPINDRLQIIEAHLTQLTNASQSSFSTPAQSQQQPRILKSASHGEKDDLKRISGIGPKLEGLLNDNGIYYFWQVAAWSAADIETMDERLDVFKGRISRDSWVSQAQALMKGSAPAIANPSLDTNSPLTA